MSQVMSMQWFDRMGAAQRAVFLSLAGHFLFLSICGILQSGLFSHKAEKMEPVMIELTPPEKPILRMKGNPMKPPTAQAPKMGFNSLLKTAFGAKNAGMQKFKTVNAAAVDPSALKAQTGHADQWTKQSSKAANQAMLKNLNGALAQKTGNLFSWENMDLSDVAGDKDGEDLNEVIQLLARHQGQFRDCYEKALFVDSRLQGQAELILAVAGNGKVQNVNVQFQKQIAESSAHGLTGCLKGLLSGVKFPPIVSGRSLKFGLMFKS